MTTAGRSHAEAAERRGQRTAGAGAAAPEVLVVCTGNVCRSPLAALLLATAFGTEAHIASAGTGALDGAPISPLSADIAEELGVPGSSAHRATAITREQVRAADLILVATREHRGDIATLVPRASRYTFTIREFARILATLAPEHTPAGDTPAAYLADAIGKAARYRGYVPAVGQDDDIVDPIGGDEALYRHMADQMVPAIEAIVTRSGIALPWVPYRREDSEQGDAGHGAVAGAGAE